MSALRRDVNEVKISNHSTAQYLIQFINKHLLCVFFLSLNMLLYRMLQIYFNISSALSTSGLFFLKSRKEVNSGGDKKILP